jgi:two-component system, OmpR family, sensor kinase
VSPPRDRRPPDAALIGRATRRLGVQAAVVVAVVVVALTTIAVLVVLDSQHRAASALLNDAVARADDVQDPPEGVFLIIRRGDGQDATPGLPAAAQDTAALDAVAAGGPARSTGRVVGAVEYLVETARHEDGSIVQGFLNLAANHAERDRLIRTMLAGGVAGLLVAAVAGSWLGRRALRPLSAALALQHRFVADAGHELRTPLTLLGTRAQLLRRRARRVAARAPDGPAAADPDCAALVADADGIVADTGRLTEILEDLLLAADPAAERTHQRLDVVALCAAGVQAAAAAAAERSVALAGPHPAGAVAVAGSPVALRRALTALLDNALRHAGERVEVRVERAGREVFVEVADDGAGIGPELAARMFDRFAGVQVPSPGPRRYGLGLALVSEIAAAHGGRVELVDPGRPGGTTIRLALPAA